VRRRKLSSEHPVGETDSEHAFCWMLEQLRAAFPGGYPRETRRLWTTIAELGAELGADGKFNFLLADGRHLYARCGTKLCYIARKAPFGRATLSDAELQIDFSAFTTPRDRVAVVATVPLTRDETWHMGQPGTMWVFRGGQLRATLPSGIGDRGDINDAARKSSPPGDPTGDPSGKDPGRPQGGAPVGRPSLTRAA
jgi:predicted glutamine amidotransferase